MNKRYSLVIFMALVSCILPGKLTSQFTPAPVEISMAREVVDGKTFFLHTVKENQTLYSIARVYGVSTADIAEVNTHHPELMEVINVGQVIRIPTTGNYEHQKPTAQETSRPVAPIQERPAVTSDVNQTLFVPKSNVQETINGKRYLIHTVHAGQTLFSIARAYSASTLVIAEANPQHPEILKGIYIGQQIRIPVTEYEKSAAPPVTDDTLWPIGLLIEDFHELKDPDCFYPELKRSYNVALLIPLFLERFGGSASGMDKYHQSFTFLPYYQGILLALDSIKKSGVNIHLHTFDLGRETATARQLAMKPEMARMDLIIGPFYQETLNIFTSFANENGISLVSPLLPSNDQLINNPSLFQAIPSTQNQLMKLAEFLKNKYQGQNILLVHNNVAEALPLIEDFKYAMRTQATVAQQTEETPRGGGDFIHGYFLNGSFVGALRSEHPPVNPEAMLAAPAGTSIKEIVLGQGGATVSRIINSLERNRNNIIVSLVGNEVIVSNMMRELNLVSNKNPSGIGRYDITLMGPARWEEFNTIDLRLFESLNVHIMSADFVDYSHKYIRDFISKYRNVFNDEPNHYAFWGVQTGFYFFNALNNYGKDFAKCISKINREASQSNLAFERFQSNKNGWFNSNLILYRINDFRRQCVLNN